MKDKEFIDTNILVYAKLEDEENIRKRDIAIALIQQIGVCPVISVQVLNEFASVLIKHQIPNYMILKAVQEIVEDTNVISLDVNLLWETWRIRDKYLFSYWDSMIISAALMGGCNILYSEDFQHEQIIENNLRIINPFHETKETQPVAS
jgi:predicted nucleic acid-binding protein